MKCEKCGTEIDKLGILMFDYDGSDYEWHTSIVGEDIETGAVWFETDCNWTGYELSEEEMMENIKCPNCGEFPFNRKEVQVCDVVRVVCFKNDNVMQSIKEVITSPQISDMGDGSGYVEYAEGCTLKHILNFYEHDKSWGTVCIHNKNLDIIRKFDYDNYNNNVFYHHLDGWWYKAYVKKVEFKYSFMAKDIDIYLQ